MNRVHAKPLWASKVLWTNLLFALAAILAEVSAIPDLGVDPKWVVVVLAVVNAALRTVTSQPVAIAPQAEPVNTITFTPLADADIDRVARQVQKSIEAQMRQGRAP